MEGLNVGNLFFELRLDSSSYDTAIENARKHAIAAGKDIEKALASINDLGKIKIQVDDSRLTDLNKHLSSKISHIKVLNNTSVNIKSETKNLLELDKSLSKIEARVSNLTQKKHVIEVEEKIKSTRSSSSAESEKTIDNISVQLEESIKKGMSSFNKAVASPFKAVGTGFFEGIGMSFSKQVSTGIQRSLKSVLNVDLQKTSESVTSNLINKVKKNNSQTRPQEQPLQMPDLKSIKQPEKLPISIKTEEIKVARKLVVATIKKDFNTLIDESLKLIVTEVKSSKPDISLAKGEFEKIRSAFSDAYSKLKVSVNDGNLGLAKAQAETIIKTSENAKQRIDKIKADLKQQGAETAFGSELATIAGSTKGVLQSKYSNPAKRQLQQINTAKEFQKAGSDVIAGTLEGLKSDAPVVRQSSLLGLKILTSFKKSLRIQSPSEDFWQATLEIGRGIVGGLIESGKNVGSAAANLGKNTLKSFTGQVSASSFKKNREAIQSQKESMKAENFGSIEFFDAFYDSFGKQFKKQAKKSFGREGGNVGREVAGMGFSLAATTAPLSTAGMALSPLLMPSLPLIATGGILNNLLQPLVAKVAQSLGEVAPIQSRLANLANSPEGGERELDYLQQTTKKYSVSTRAGADAYSKLSFATRGTKLEGEETKRIFEGISVAVRAMGLTSADSSLVFQAFTQMVAKGKISMEELRQQLGEKFPPAMGVFAKAMGVSVAEMNTLVSKGALLSEDVLPKVADVLLKDFSKSATDSGSAFINATTRMENAGFALSINLAKSFGGIFSGVINAGAGIAETFNENFGQIAKVAGVALVGMTAQIAVGLQAIASSPQIASKFALVQNFFLSSFTKSFSALTPFLAATFIDLIDDVLGAKNSVFDNMSQGITQLFIGLFAGLDGLSRGLADKPLFNVSFDPDQVGVVQQVASSFQSFFKLIPPGVGELAALVLMFEQVKVLGGIFLAPMFKGIGTALGGMSAGVVKSLANVRNLKDAFSSILPVTANLSKNLLVGFKNIALESGLALATMVLARSDFSDPLTASFNESKTKIVGNIQSIGHELKSLADISKGVGKDIVQSLTLPSKGLELNIGKIFGLSEESFKSDDLFKKLNQENSFFSTKELTEPEAKRAQALKTRADSLGVGDFFTGKEKYETLAQKQLLNQASDLAKQKEALNTKLSGLNLTPDTAKNFVTPALKSTISDIEKIDTKIKGLGDRRRDLSLINTSKTRTEVKQLDVEINNLLKQRKTAQKPLEAILGNVDDLKVQLEAQEQAIEKSNLPSTAKRALKNALEPQKEMIEETIAILKDQRLYDLIKPLEDVWTRVIDKLRDADEAYEKFQNQFKEGTIRQQTSVYSSGMSDANVKRSLDVNNISNIQTQTEALQKILSVREKSLREILTIPGVETSEARKKEVESLRDNIKKDKLDLAESQLQIAQARATLNREMREQTKQVADYYKNIARQAELQSVEFKKLSNQLDTTKQQNKIRQALIDGSENIFTQYADSLIEELEQIKAISDRKLDADAQLLNNRNQFQDSLQSGLDLKRSLPGEIPKIPIELDLSSVADDANIQDLNEQISNATNSTGDLGSEIAAVKQQFDESVDTAGQLTGQLDNSSESAAIAFQEINKITLGIGNSNTALDGLNAEFGASNTAIASANTSTGQWAQSLNPLQSVVQSIQDVFKNIGDTINNLIAQTSAWVANLGQVPGLIQGAIGAVANQSPQETFSQLKQGAQDFGSTVKAGWNQIFGSKKVIAPVSGPITSGFGHRNIDVAGASKYHDGIDYGVGIGTTVKAPTSGKISRVFRSTNGGGNVVELKSLGDKGEQITQSFLHLERALVKVGDSVKQGDAIAKSGNTGIGSGAHLHWRVHINGQKVDPQKFLKMNVNVVAGSSQAQQQQPVSAIASPKKLGNANMNDPRQNMIDTRSPTLSQGKYLFGKASNYTPSDLSKLTPTGKKALEYLKNANIRAFLDSSAAAELGKADADKGGYGYLFGDVGGKETFNPNTLTSHPKRRVSKWGHTSSATGRYQTMDFVWDDDTKYGSKGLGLQDFKPQSQEILAVGRLMYRGVADKIASGDIQGSLKKASGEWASIQGNPYGQGTPDGKIPKFMQNFQEYKKRALLGNQQSSQRSPQQIGATAQSAAVQNKAIAPSQLQSTVDAATTVSRQQFERQQSATRAQEQADTKRQQQELLRKRNQRIKQFERTDRELDDSARNDRRDITDTAASINKNPTRKESFAIESTNIDRKYDDKIRERQKKISDLQKSINSGEQLLASGTVPEGEKPLLVKQLDKQKKALKEYQSQLERLKQLRKEDAAEAFKLSQREEALQRQSVGFETRESEISTLQSQLDNLQKVADNRPYGEEARAIPGLQKQIRLKQIDLDLDKEISRIQEDRFNNKYNDTEAKALIEQAKKRSIKQQEGVEIDFNSGNTEQSRKEKKRELDERLSGENNVLSGLKSQLEVAKQLANTDPYSASALNIPILEQEIVIREADLALTKDLADAEEELYTTRLSPAGYEAAIAAAKERNEQAKKNIKLVTEEAIAQQKLKVARRALEAGSSQANLDSQIINAKLSSPALEKEKNTGKYSALQLQRFQAQSTVEDFNLQSQIADAEELFRTNQRSRIETDTYINSLRQLNSISLSGLREEINRSIGENQINQLNKVKENFQTAFDLTRTNSINLTNAKADAYLSRGGNQFVANQMKRDTGTEVELQRRDQELQSFDVSVLTARLKGITLDDYAIAQARSDIEALSNINLENLNEQFKTFSGTVEDLGKQAFKGLSSDITNLILKGGELSDVFNNFATTILNGVLNSALDSLIGGLTQGMFGGGGGRQSSGGGILDFVSGIFGGGGGGLLGGLFYDGGMVKNYAEGGIVAAMARERSMTGARPHLAVLSEGERVLTIEQAKRFNALNLDRVINNYADGGMVGSSAPSPLPNIQNSASSTNVNVVVNVTGDKASGNTDGSKLGNSLKNSIISTVLNERRPGGALYGI